jgi:hypothetical protein
MIELACIFISAAVYYFCVLLTQLRALKRQHKELGQRIENASENIHEVDRRLASLFQYVQHVQREVGRANTEHDNAMRLLSLRLQSVTHHQSHDAAPAVTTPALPAHDPSPTLPPGIVPATSARDAWGVTQGWRRAVKQFNEGALTREDLSARAEYEATSAARESDAIDAVNTAQAPAPTPEVPEAAFGSLAETGALEQPYEDAFRAEVDDLARTVTANATAKDDKD